jgi:GTPase
MMPVGLPRAIVLVGRPNVGKSTLFNRLTRSRAALVSDSPGVTRDRQYGTGWLGECSYWVVDTGGLVPNLAQRERPGDRGRETGGSGLSQLAAEQTRRALEDAAVVLFVVDAREGLTADDMDLAADLRRVGKPVLVVANKAEGKDPVLAGAEFHALGLGQPHVISAAHGQGVASLIEAALSALPEDGPAEELPQDTGTRIAVVGRPNVGKSTLVNRMLGEERVLTFDQPGTTRDSILVPFSRFGRRYTLIDTAGLRRRARVQESIEQVSAIKTLQAVEYAHVVILLLDARQGIAEQDAALLGWIGDLGKGLVIAVNKWDGLAAERRAEVRSELDRRLAFLDYARIHCISALHGSGVGELFASVDEAYEASTRKLSTPQLTRILEEAVHAHAPPAVHGRRIKLRYAHQGGQNPPLVVIHGNQTAALPENYKRYLQKTFRRVLGLQGAPVHLEFRSGGNPFEGRKNVLTPRQIAKRRRLMEHVK